MKKMIVSITTASVLSCCSLTALAATMAMPQQQNQANYQKLEQQIAQLQQQLTSLKQQASRNQQQAAAKNNQATVATSSDHAATTLTSIDTPFGSLVTTGPSIGMPSYYGGATGVIVNSSSINEDYKLLARTKAEQDALKKSGYSSVNHPRLILSGAIETQAYHEKDHGSDYTTRIDLSRSELDSYAEINHWVNFYSAFAYDDALSGSSSSNPYDFDDNSNLYVDKAFIVVGNLSKTPIYGSMGQEYVDFGRFSYATISNPLTKDIFRIKGRAITVGFHPNNPNTVYGATYVYSGQTVTSNQGGSVRADNFGADLAYQFQTNNGFKGDVGVSGVSNVADSDGMKNSVAAVSDGGSDYSYGTIHRDVAGVDVHGDISFKQLTLVGEYAQALSSFDKQDLSYNNDAAKPKAATVEADMGANVANQPLTFALSAGYSKQALGLGVPAQRYMAAVTDNVFKNVLVSLEYKLEKNYSTSNSADNGSGTVSGTGGTNNVVTAQVGVYF